MSIGLHDAMHLDPDDLRRVRCWLGHAPRGEDPRPEALADWLERGHAAPDAALVERALAADPHLLATLLVLNDAVPQAPSVDELHRASSLVAVLPDHAASLSRRSGWQWSSGWRQALAVASVLAATGVGLVLGDGLAAAHWQQEQRALAAVLFGAPVNHESGDLR